MKKNVSLFLFIILCSISLKAQSYIEEHYQYNKYWTLMSGHYHHGEYDLAAQYPDSIVDNHFFNNNDVFFVAKIYAADVNYQKALEFLEKSIKRGTTLIDIEHSYDLDYFRESNLYIIIELNYDKWHQEYLIKQNKPPINSVYAKKIQEINKTYNATNDKLWVHVKNDSVYYSSDSLTRFFAKNTIDSLFYSSLDFVLENGIPTKDNSGEDFYSFHRFFTNETPVNFDFESKKGVQFVKLINDEINKGNIKPFYLAALIDYQRINQKKPLVYGLRTFVYNLNKIEFLEIENPEEINIRRRNVGLCPIELKLWSTAQDLPPALKNIQFK